MKSLKSIEGVQNTSRLQPQDLQQPGVCRAAGTVSQPGLRGRVPIDPDVHHPHEFCQGLGRRVPPANSHLDSLLDRAAPQRTAAMAGSGPHPNGLALHPLFVHELTKNIQLQQQNW